MLFNKIPRHSRYNVHMESYSGTPAKSQEELRARQAEKLIGFLEKARAFEYVQNILTSSEESPNFDEFKDHLTRINGMAREIPTKKREFDGKDVEISGFVDTVAVPREEDKESLLRYAWEVSPRISKDDLKYMLPAVVNAVHAFADGNGRTSRTLHLLLRDYPSPEECYAEMRKALSEDGRWDSFDINPGLISSELEHEVLKQHGWKFTESGQLNTLGPIQSGVASAEQSKISKTSPEGKAAREFLSLYHEDVPYGLTAIHMLLGDEGIESVSDVYDGTVRISPLKMISALTVEEWAKFIDNFYQLKKEHVEELVNVFVEPQRHVLSDGSGTVRDYFVSRVEKLPRHN
jgi:hypothetical protein